MSKRYSHCRTHLLGLIPVPVVALPSVFSSFSSAAAAGASTTGDEDGISEVADFAFGGAMDRASGTSSSAKMLVRGPPGSSRTRRVGLKSAEGEPATEPRDQKNW